jgi:hypothetical protein
MLHIIRTIIRSMTVEASMQHKKHETRQQVHHQVSTTAFIYQQDLKRCNLITIDRSSPCPLTMMEFG